MWSSIRIVIENLKKLHIRDNLGENPKFGETLRRYCGRATWGQSFVFICKVRQLHNLLIINLC